MTAATTAVPTRGDLTGHVTFAHLLRSEWIKLWSLRSTWWCLIITLVIMVLIALLAGTTVSSAVDETGTPIVTPGNPILGQAVVAVPMTFAQLVMAVLGCLVISGEYGSGMIRTTMLAAPRRIPAVLAKAVVIGVVAALTAVVGILVGLLIAAPLMSGKSLEVDLGDVQLWRVLVGGVVYLAAVTVLSTGIGLILRVSAGAIATAMGLLLVLPIIGQLISGLTQTVWIQNVTSFLPNLAGAEMYAWQYGDVVYSQPGAPEPPIDLDWWQGGLVLLAWVVVLWVIGLVLVKRRDV